MVIPRSHRESQQNPEDSRVKPLLFSEEQIRAKAYEIWQSRNGAGGSSEEDWQAAIEALKREQTPLIWRWPLSAIKGVWNWTGIQDKKGWDFLQLLVVPLTLAIVGLDSRSSPNKENSRYRSWLNKENSR